MSVVISIYLNFVLYYVQFIYVFKCLPYLLPRLCKRSGTLKLIFRHLLRSLLISWKTLSIAISCFLFIIEWSEIWWLDWHFNRTTSTNKPVEYWGTTVAFSAEERHHVESPYCRNYHSLLQLQNSKLGINTFLQLVYLQKIKIPEPRFRFKTYHL